MEAKVRDKIELKHQDSIRGFVNDNKLYIKTPKETTIQDLPIHYSSS